MARPIAVAECTKCGLVKPGAAIVIRPGHPVPAFACLDCEAKEKQRTE